MKCVNVMFNECLSDQLVAEFEKKIYFISEKIDSFDRIKQNDTIIGLRLFCTDDVNSAEIEQTAVDVLTNEVIGLRSLTPNRVWENTSIKLINGERVLNDLLSNNMVQIHGEGQISFKEPLVELFGIIDFLFRKISTDIFKGENYRFPTLLKTSILKKVGYFDSFPNLLMFTTRLKNEVNNYKEFKQNFNNINDFESAKKTLLGYCNIMDYSLPPTMCYYVYDMLSNRKISNQCITAGGKSFRFENKYCKPFERLWDFTIRETVFLGGYEYVKKNVNAYRNAAITVAQLLDLKGFCETANDPFFLTDNTTDRINVQKMYGSKYELRINTDGDHTIAVGSFNLHGQFLARRFNLLSEDQEQEFIYTGCIGIGIERFMYGFLAQYGTNIDSWPKIIKDAFVDIHSIDNVIEKLKEVIDV